MIPQSGSFSGADIVATVYVPTLQKYMVFGELATISYSIHRELNPVRALGTINPKGYCRGPRTTAGSLIFTVFNRHVLYEARSEAHTSELQSRENLVCRLLLEK